MHNFLLKKYYFINKFDSLHLKKINEKVSIIYRNYEKKTNIKLLKKIKFFCNKNGFEFFLSNNFKLALKLNLSGVYIPSFNKEIIPNCYKKKINFKLIGSVHNIYELNTKKMQQVDEIFISPVFKKKTKILGVYGFLKLKRNSNFKNIALGGINKKNLKILDMLKADGFAAIKYFDKKKGPYKQRP